ncbi:transposase [Microbispora cellulosiformans]|uniref:Transposase n=1 Tax=Microbispora cellulosiformans TaxID=2614688 RepID=A0A5J5JTY3_9ACTN|nr:transposase [Microbispora cellulosiformans]
MPGPPREVSMPRSYPPEFRRKVLDLLRAGRTVQQVAADLQISDQTIYNWRRQERIDAGLEPGITSSDLAELVAARRRIAELETELAVTRWAGELLREVVSPKRRFEAIAVMGGEGLPVQVCCHVMGVSESGYYAWRSRPPSPRSVRHAWLTEVIREAHAASRGVYGARRVHAELILGRGIAVGHGQVTMLMHRAGIKGLPGNRRRRPVLRCRRRPTWSIGCSPAPVRISCGSPTSPSTRPGRARSTAASCWMPIRSGWWAGPSTPPRPPPWSPTRSAWPSTTVTRRPER